MTNPATSPLATGVRHGRAHRHDARLSLPSYDRHSLTPGVVHLGVGGFHRSHQATYFDDLAELGISTDWGLVGAGLRSRTLCELLVPQDCLYTVLERDHDHTSARVVGAMTSYHYGPDDPQALLDRLTDPSTRLVTLTLTAQGYPLDQDGELDVRRTDVRTDLRSPDRPRTAFGYLVEALRRRRAAGLPGFTVLSCDNVPDNGPTTRACVLGLAEERDPALAAWIARHVTFPSSMVDRITPPTTAHDRRELRRRFGVDDRCPVVSEPFKQWVVEDEFCNGRPPLEEVGVELVTDVRPHKQVKTRLLNGAHCAVGFLGHLSGHATSAEAMADPILAELVRRLMAEEVAPLLPVMPALDLEGYQRSVLRRIANTGITDPIERLSARGSVRMPNYLLPSLHQALTTQRPRSLLTLVVAGWVRYLRGTDDQGHPIAIDDPQAERLHALALRGGADPRPLLSLRTVFGNLEDHADFVDELEMTLRHLDALGVRGLLEARMGERRVAAS